MLLPMLLIQKYYVNDMNTDTSSESKIFKDTKLIVGRQNYVALLKK